MRNRRMKVEDIELEPLATVEEAVETTLLPAASLPDDAGDSDITALYLREAREEPLLTMAQEQELGRTIEEGKEAIKSLNRKPQSARRAALLRAAEKAQQARIRMARANARLVISIAKRYRNQGLPFLDLIQEGNLGLLKAIDKFDYKRGYKFSTYATWWIRQAVTRGLS